MNSTHRFISYLLFSCFFSVPLIGQTFQSFEGKLVYSVEVIHPETKKAKFVSLMTIYANDSLIRTETESTNFGTQIVIKHLTYRKQYLLIESNSKKYAIQQPTPKDTNTTKYTLRNKCGRKKIAGIKSKKIEISSKTYPEPQICFYSERYSPHYLELFPGIKGLPTEYFLMTEDGLIKYTLREITPTKLSPTLFTFTKDYTKISLNDFIDLLSK
jgi:hypothetical protein